MPLILAKENTELSFSLRMLIMQPPLSMKTSQKSASLCLTPLMTLQMARLVPISTLLIAEMTQKRVFPAVANGSANL